MMQFICYFFPAFLSVRLLMNKRKSTINQYLDFFLNYVQYVILINLCIYVFLYFFTPHRYSFLTIGHFNISFSLQYLLLALIIAEVLPMIHLLLRKYFSIEVKLDKKDVE